MVGIGLISEKLLLTMTDEQLAVISKDGNEDAFEVLVARYKGSVLSKARTYYLIGADREDIIQEGMIGLVKAIRDYKEERNSSFRAFAELCITRQIITAIKTATRQKHIPLNSYISLSRPVYEDEGDSRTLLEMIESDTSCNPEECIIQSESYRGANKKILKILSHFERLVLRYYLKGKSYSEISKMIDKPAKSIDNALQRIKRKLERFYEECG